MNKSIKHTVFAGVIVIIFYLVASLFQLTLLSDIFASICSSLAAVIIFYVIFTSDAPHFNPNFILTGLSVLLWAVADILWAFYAIVLHQDPGGIEIISLLYCGTNIFLFLSTIIFFVVKFQKWDSIQLIVDSIFITVAIIWLLWILLFDKQYSALGFLSQDSIINTLSIITDVVQLIVITIWYLSIRAGKIPLFFRIVSGSIFFYSILDLFYFYSIWKNTYTPNTLLDVGYAATLLGLSVGTKLFYVQFPTGYKIQSKSNSNIGHLYKGILMSAAPILVVIFKGFVWFDLFFFGALILFHETFSRYIQTSVNNMALLERELTLNQDLEMRISERTRNLQQKNEELLYLSEHDQLTGLYNRMYFLQRLDHMVNSADPSKKIALLLWNIDRLKGINDTYGQSVGDKLIAVLAKRVNNLTEEKDTLARLGGDEFVMAIEGVIEKRDVEIYAKRIIDACGRPIKIGQYTFHITVGMGISIFPLCALDAETLMKNADIAMRFAKDTGTNGRMSFYNDIDAVIKRKRLVASYLKKADFAQELSVHYQPQFCIADMSLVGMEALLRWNCPALGAVPASEFIPIAEEENLIIPIGNWVIDKAIRQISSWNHEYNTNLKMGINISPKQLDQTDVLEVMNASIHLYNAEVSWIDIEITEGIAIDNDDKAARIRQFFQDQGISISIDDFGTGYSSLGYLNMLSFDRLKIAKPLIDRIAIDETSVKIVYSIIGLAKSLGIQTIAEGVEAKEQFEMLLDFGCDQIQGFYLGKPLPPESFQSTFLSNGFIEFPSTSISVTGLSL